MQPSILKRMGAGAMKALSFLYWCTAACMILGGASGALLLVAVFLFPFVPLIGGLLLVQAAGMLRPKASPGLDNVSKPQRSASSAQFAA